LTPRRTQVAIVGAGPAGLMLGHLLSRAGIDSVILERQSRDHVEQRIRAGVLEDWVARLLRDSGVGQRMDREGLVHHGIQLAFEGARHRLDLTALSGGRSVMVYGQHEVVKDLVARRLEDGLPLTFEAAGVRLHDLETARPRVTWDGGALTCDVVAGCDGFHGLCRAAIPAERITTFERSYPFAWLGILAEAPPASEELVYASHARGFALLSMRSAAVSRLYLQCAPDEDLSAWSDRRIWDELGARLELPLAEGPILQRGVTAMRSFVAEPLRHGRLFLAGDAAHIVPPTGAKGMNLALADVTVLARALEAFFREGSERLLERYSATCLRRVWKAQRFSAWMTSLLHRFPEQEGFARWMQLAELDYLTGSAAAAAALAENYVGLPFDA
jgi:p-hydroxybenzoate 3-monooxygenase